MTTSSDVVENGSREVRIGGTEVHYYVLCPRKLWWFSHGMEQEHVQGAEGQENVALGQLLHKESYPDKTRKDILIDDLLRLDFTEGGAVHEIKKSKGGQRATLFQMLYYLYYLKHEKGIETTGVIDYPRQRRRQEVALTPELEAEVERALALAREIVRGAAHSLLRNVAYYSHRKSGRPGEEEEDREPEGEIGAEPLPQTGVPQDAAVEAAIDAAPDLPDLESDPDAEDPFAPILPVPSDLPPGTLADFQDTISGLAALIDTQMAVNSLRGIEGKMRVCYYQAWRHILNEGWAFDRRVRRPPDNEINALISFGNSVLYTVCLSEIYRTQLTPTISYLHEPGARRFSLALDLSEIFKPLLVDRAIFRLINTGQLRAEHFDRSLGGCYLVEAGKKLFLSALEERMAATIKHRRLGRHVSYRHLIRLECYKLIRHLTDVEPYRAFRAWW